MQAASARFRRLLSVNRPPFLARQTSNPWELRASAPTDRGGGLVFALPAPPETRGSPPTPHFHCRVVPATNGPSAIRPRVPRCASFRLCTNVHAHRSPAPPGIRTNTAANIPAGTLTPGERFPDTALRPAELGVAHLAAWRPGRRAPAHAEGVNGRILPRMLAQLLSDHLFYFRVVACQAAAVARVRRGVRGEGMCEDGPRGA